MGRAPQYQTRQKEVVEEAFMRLGGKHTTVDELTRLLAKSGNAVGRTTVYRTLERLVQTGQARKYSAVQGESACYQPVADHGCQEHFHLKCESCGRLIHMSCSQMDFLTKHVAAEHGFRVDPLKTVLYGVREDCQKQ